MAPDRYDDRRRPGALVRGLLPRRVGAVVEAADPAVLVPEVEQPRDLESVIGDCALYEHGGRRGGPSAVA